jgi:hypothetical protein
MARNARGFERDGLKSDAERSSAGDMQDKSRLWFRRIRQVFAERARPCAGEQ